MEILIFAIIALIAAVLLIKNYEKIDSALFSQNNPDYESTGRPIIFVSLLMGAVSGAVFIYNQLTDSSTQLTAIYTYTGASLLTICILIAWFTTLCSRISISMAIGKCLFLTLCTAVAFGLGFAGTLIVFAVMVIWFMIAVFSGALKENKVQVKSEGLFGMFATKDTLSHVQGDEYEGTDGSRWTRNGNEFTKIE